MPSVGVVEAELEGICVRAGTQAGMKPGEALLMPRLQTRNGQSQLAAERIQGLAAKQAEDGLDLACGVPSAGWRQRCSGPACGGSGRATPSLRRRRRGRKGFV